MAGVVFCNIVVGGYWIVLIVLEMLMVRALVEMFMGKKAVALPVGRAMT